MRSHKFGNLFFKIRSYTPIPFILLLFYFASPYLLSTLIGTLIICLGEFIRIWSVGYAGGSTRATTLGAARDLVTTGPYSFVRNPLYLGNFLLSFGTCIVANVIWLIPILIITFFIQYIPIIKVEESYLLESCGSIYIEYLENVPRFLPKLYPYQNQSVHDFSITRAIKSEKRTVMAIIFVNAVMLLRNFI